MPDTLFDYMIQYNYLKNFDYGIYRNHYTEPIFQIITGTIKKGSKEYYIYQPESLRYKEAYDVQILTRPPAR